ncbi:MAG: metallophosphoesterase family protein [Sphingomonadales bacterium]|nr:metallophosphoesterase family protein [Sphingomonadales bacterium]
MILGSAPVLVFGGPYSNLRALQLLRARAIALGVSPSRIICTGDVVAYCAEPEETIAAIRDWGCHVVAGNCEQQLALGADDCGCGFAQGSTCDSLSKGWYAFATGRVSAASRAWMGQLPDTLSFTYGGFSLRVVHGGVDQTNRFVFPSQEALIAAELARARADIVIAGHAGLPFIKRYRDQVWFNPGVVGMPANDGTAEVWYGLVRRTDDGLSFLTQRLAYDHEGAALAMRGHGYADAYADALVSGRWPSIDVLPAAERAATGKSIQEQELIVPRPSLCAHTSAENGCCSVIRDTVI